LFASCLRFACVLIASCLRLFEGARGRRSRARAALFCCGPRAQERGRPAREPPPPHRHAGLEALAEALHRLAALDGARDGVVACVRGGGGGGGLRWVLARGFLACACVCGPPPERVRGPAAALCNGLGKTVTSSNVAPRNAAKAPKLRQPSPASGPAHRGRGSWRCGWPCPRQPRRWRRRTAPRPAWEAAEGAAGLRQSASEGQTFPGGSPRQGQPLRAGAAVRGGIPQTPPRAGRGPRRGSPLDCQTGPSPGPVSGQSRRSPGAVRGPTFSESSPMTETIPDLTASAAACIDSPRSFTSLRPSSKDIAPLGGG
jgi:hypothetical protein